MSDCAFCTGKMEPIKRTSRKQMLTEYREMFGVLFPPEVLETNFNFDTITSLCCMQCGTIGFTPQILGNSAYYNHLSKTLPWYYASERWEYPIALKLLNREKVAACLEIGCGSGHFLKRMRGEGLEGHGYDIEPDSVRSLQDQGFLIHSSLNGSLGMYDAIAMFQVLEHFADPCDFLLKIASNLRSGGAFLISTPVAPSCTAFSDNPFLYPPHHQWLPTKEGFKGLARRLGFICESVQYEPAYPFQLGQLEYGLRKRFELNWGMKRWFGRLPVADKLAEVMFRIGVRLKCNWAQVGHTTLVTLRKC
jgi:SAM-dependent methyltransferase